MTQQDFIAQAQRILGPKGWVSPEDASEWTADITGPGPPPLFLARPADTGEVSAILRLCHDHRIAVVPQGGNTNVCRMAIVTDPRPSILLSLSRMTRMEEIDPVSATATVQAGCIMQHLQEAAAEQGLLFAPDWGARGSATVGGAVATNGGGLNVLRYGTTREQVLGMEVVLPDGRVWNGMRRLIKDNSGYDMKQMFIGSEGTLGVITRLVFRLHPLPRESRSMFASLSDMAHLSGFLDLCRRTAGNKLTAFELLPGQGVEMALARYPDLRHPIEERAEWYVLLRLSGGADVEECLMSLFEKGFEDGMLSDAAMALSQAQENNFWELREQMIPHQYFQGLKMLKWDVSVPPDRIVPFLTEAGAALHAIAPQARTHAVGHVGDGNIHLSAYLTAEDDHLADDVYRRIDTLIWDYDGSIVAEHGVGSLYRARVQQQKSGVEYDMLRALKDGFDPHGLMNPGKLLSGARPRG